MMFPIKSYISAGPISFGMEADEVVSALGAPVSQEITRSGDTILRYNGFGITVSKMGVVELYFLPTEDVSVYGIDIYGDKQAFQKLCALDTAPKEFLGFIVLPNIGITLTGFHDNDESQKAITVFAKGRWDQLSNEMKNYIAP